MRPVLTGEIPAPIAQGYAEFDTRLDTASTRAWRDRKLEFYPDPPTIDETFPHLAAVRAASGVGWCMAVPLDAAGEVTGVLAVYWSAPRQLSADEEAFTTAVSGYAAQALARALLFEAEQAARTTAGPAGPAGAHGRAGHRGDLGPDRRGAGRGGHAARGRARGGGHARAGWGSPADVADAQLPRRDRALVRPHTARCLG